MSKATWAFIALVVTMGLLVAAAMSVTFLLMVRDTVEEELQARADSAAERLKLDTAALMDDAEFLAKTLQVHGLERAVDAGGIDPATGFSVEQWWAHLTHLLVQFEHAKSDHVAARIVGAPTLANGRSGVIGDQPTDGSGLQVRELVNGVLEDRRRLDAQARPYRGFYEQDGQWYAVAAMGVGNPGDHASSANVILIKTVSPLFQQMANPRAAGSGLGLYWQGHAVPTAWSSEWRGELFGESSVTFDNGVLGVRQFPLRAKSGTMIPFMAGLGAVAVVLMIGIVVASRLIRRLTVPVVEITDAVDSFSKGGEVITLETSGWAEIGSLAESINRCMAMFVEQAEKVGESHAALERRESYLRTIQESAPVGIISVTHDGRIHDANALAQRMLGFSPGSERDFLQMLRNSTQERPGSIAAIDGITLRLPEGMRVAINVGTHYSAEGPFHVVILSDITALSDAEARARQNEAFLDAIIESLPLMLFIKDAENLKFVRINRRGEELLGIGRQELIGKTDHEVFSAAEAQVRLDADRAIVASGYAQDIPEEMVTTRRGETRYLHTRKLIVRGGELGGRFLLGLSEDITEAREVSLSQKRNEQLLGAVFESAPFPMLLCDANHFSIVRANSASEVLFGRSRSQLESPESTELLPVEYERRLRKFVRSQSSTDTMEIVTKADDPRMLEVRLAKIRNEAGDATYVLAIIDDVTDRRAAQEQMENGRVAAERANHAKSAFLAAMSHEIRTPMNGVLGTLDLLTRTPLSQEQSKLSGIAFESARSLLRVIEDVLDFSKIESDKMEIEFEPFHLDKTVESVVASLWRQADSSGVQLGCSVDASIPNLVEGDAVRIRQIVYNLLGNAIKFRDAEKGTSFAKIGCEQTADRRDGRVWIRFWVEDNGIGIMPDRLESVFEAFEQAEVSTTRRFGGSGLGLAICKRLVTMMGGTIDVFSEHGKGTRFEVNVPFAPVAETERSISLQGLQAFLDVSFDVADQVYRYLAASQVEVHPASSLDDEHAGCGQPIVILEDRAGYAQRMQEIRSRHADSRFVVLARRASCNEVDTSIAVCLSCRPLGRASLLEAVAVAAGRESPYEDAQPVPLLTEAERSSIDTRAEEAAGRLILVAEDNEANQTVIEHQLISLGFACHIASDGAQALALMTKHRFGCVLADCHMPEMDGYALTAAIRAMPCALTSNVPIIAFTANALKGEADRCLRSGMDDYLSKPVTMDDLGSKLRLWVDTLQREEMDRRVLEQVVGDDPAVQQRVGRRVLESLVDARSEIMASGEDWERLRRIAHKLKSGARSVGLLKLGDACERLEQAATEQSLTVQPSARTVLRLAALSEELLRREFELGDEPVGISNRRAG